MRAVDTPSAHQGVQEKTKGSPYHDYLHELRVACRFSHCSDCVRTSQGCMLDTSRFVDFPLNRVRQSTKMNELLHFM